MRPRTPALEAAARRFTTCAAAALQPGTAAPTPDSVTDIYDDLRPDRIREVEVQWDDDRWYPGWLEVWRRVAGEWSGSVCFTTGIGETRVGFVPADRIRPAPVR